MENLSSWFIVCVRSLSSLGWCEPPDSSILCGRAGKIGTACPWNPLSFTCGCGVLVRPLGSWRKMIDNQSVGSSGMSYLPNCGHHVVFVRYPPPPQSCEPYMYMDLFRFCVAEDMSCAVIAIQLAGCSVWHLVDALVGACVGLWAIYISCLSAGLAEGAYIDPSTGWFVWRGDPAIDWSWSG